MARVLLAVAFLCLVQLAAAQFGMPGMGMEQPKAAAVKSDVQYIRCQTCEAFVKQAYRHIKSQRRSLKPGQKLSESDIIEHLEQMCDPSKPAGQWLSHYDIVEKGVELKLVDTGKPSKCDVECMTITRACSQVADDLDLSDLSEALFLGKQRAALSTEACHEASNVCRKKPPPVPKDRKPGPPHVPMSPEEAQREQLMASMKASGLSGQMYSRDDVMSQLGDLQESMGGGADGSVDGPGADAGGGDGDASGGLGLGASVSKAKEVVVDAVESAKGAAAAVVDRAGELLKSSLGKLGSSLRESRSRGSGEGKRQGKGSEEGSEEGSEL